MRISTIVNKLSVFVPLVRIKGFRYFLKNYIFRRILRVVSFGPSYIPLRSFEVCLSPAHNRRYSLPNYLQLEPTSKCNMKCRNCTRDNLLYVGDLKLKDFFYLIKQFPFLKEAKLQGLGEPLLNDSIFEMAGFLKRKNIETYIATNGTLITKDTASKLIKYFDKIEISIDSPNRSTFKNIRGKDCLDQVLEGAGLINRLNNGSDIAVNFVLERENVTELPEMIMLLHDLKINHINIVGLQNWIAIDSRHLNKRKELLEREPKDTKVIADYFRKAVNLAKSFNIYVSSSVSDGYKHKCFWYKRGVYISWNGYVMPCCIRPDYQDFNFGNVFEKNIRDIWNSYGYINFRKELASGKVPLLCKGCSYI